jgi:hypothetical protein
MVCPPMDGSTRLGRPSGIVPTTCIPLSTNGSIMAAMVARMIRTNFKGSLLKNFFPTNRKAKAMIANARVGRLVSSMCCR